MKILNKSKFVHLFRPLFFAVSCLTLVGVSGSASASLAPNADQRFALSSSEWFSDRALFASENHISESTEVTILHVTSDIAEGFSDIKLELAEGKVHSIRQYTHKGLKAEF